MKPLKLTMAAFGPFADPQVIDLRQLGSASLLLITGATGAGKTTILDAICFALYGDTSGNERDPRQMRSHHARADMPTYIEFEFSLGNEVYRVLRKPQQERPRTRGGGTTTQATEATLWRQTGVPEGAEGPVLADRPDRVTKEIERLLGFESRQFRQVVVLPQGKFRALLMSDSGERQAILQAIFKTEWYALIEQAMKERAAEVEKEVAASKAQRQLLLQQVGVQTEKELDAQCTEAEARLTSAQQDLLEQVEARDTARRAREAGEQAQAKLNEERNAWEALDKLNRSRAEIDAMQAVLRSARQAAELADAESNVQARWAELQAAKRQRADASHLRDLAQASWENADHALQIEQGREKEHEEARQAVDRLVALETDVTDLGVAKANAATAKSALEAAEEARYQAYQTWETLSGDLQTAQTDSVALQQLASELDLRKLAEESAEQAEGWRKELDAASLAYKRATELHETAKSEREGAECRHAQALSDLRVLEQEWFEGQAAILARELLPDQPCPVCGATDHPAPAVATHPLPSESDVKSARALVETLTSGLEEQRQADAALGSEMNGWKLRREMLEQNLGSRRSSPPKDLKNQHKLARKAREEAEAAQANLPMQQELIAKLTGEVTVAWTNVDNLDQILTDASSAILRAEAVVVEREGKIPAQLREPKALQRELRSAKARLQRLGEALALAVETIQSTREGAATAETALRAAIDAESQAEQRYGAQAFAFENRLSELGFADDVKYQAAKRTPGERDELARRIQEYEGGLAAATDRYGRAQQGARGLVEVDVEALRNAERAADEAHAQAIDNVSNSRQRLSQEKKWESDLGKINGNPLCVYNGETTRPRNLV